MQKYLKEKQQHPVRLVKFYILSKGSWVHHKFVDMRWRFTALCSKPRNAFLENLFDWLGHSRDGLFYFRVSKSQEIVWHITHHYNSISFVAKEIESVKWALDFDIPTLSRLYKNGFCYLWKPPGWLFLYFQSCVKLRSLAAIFIFSGRYKSCIIFVCVV